jgi:hypothetical protein
MMISLCALADRIDNFFVNQDVVIQAIQNNATPLLVE